MFEKEISEKKRISNEFISFKSKILRSKHSFWFDVLDDFRKFELFMQFKRKRHEFSKLNKSFSFNKYIFNQRKSRKFHIPLVLLRDSAINKILK